MEELMNELTKKEVKIESVLSQLETLSDQEILEIFDNEEISISVKQKILEKAHDRINKLNTQAFIEVFSWLEDSNVLPYYLNHIEKFTYEEFVEFLLNGVYNEKTMLTLAESKIYKNYLEEEKTKELGTILQINELEKRLLLLNNNVKELENVGTEIIKLIDGANGKEELSSLINFFLDKMIENMDSIPNESECLKSVFEILRTQMKSHKLMTPKMIEFYCCYYIKKENVEDFCQHVIVTLGKGKNTAFYTLTGYNNWKNGTLKIYYENMIEEYKNFKQKISDDIINDLVNLNMIHILTHEAKHIMDRKEDAFLTNNISIENFYDLVFKNKLINTHTKELFLREKMGEEGYNANHNTFLSEAKADIFSYFETNKELQTRFNDCFDKRIKASILLFYAQSIVNYYTDEEGRFISPSEKLNKFFIENGGEEKYNVTTPVAEEETDIFAALLNGEPIPIELYEFLKQIASAKIITDDLEATLKVFINAIHFIKEETASQTL